MNEKVSWSNRFEVKPGRWVYNPTQEARIIGLEINQLIKANWEPPSYYYHLRSGGHIAALKTHLDSEYFAVVDISDFFGSISRSRITRSLKQFLGYEQARKIAKKSTVTSGPGYQHSHYLPYGFVQSPILASLAFHMSSLGNLLEELSMDNRLQITVYMDDIVLSSNDSSYLSNVFRQVTKSAERAKFLVNENKSRPVSRRVTAFNIKLSNKEMELTRERFIEFQRAYVLSNNPAQRRGIGAYVGTVNKTQATWLI